MKKCFMFPGQGSQTPGMAKSLGVEIEKVKDVFECASDIFEKDMLDLMTNASLEEISSTQNIQAAVTTMNAAYVNLLRSYGVTPDIAIGNSLGQFSAMYAAGCYDMETLFKSIKSRTEIYAKNTQIGKHLAILGLEKDVVENICKELDVSGENISVALYNAPTQIVVGGFEEYIIKAQEKAKENNAFRTVILNTPNAFHTNVMKPVEKEFNDFLGTIDYQTPKCKLLLNSKGLEVHTKDEILDDLKGHCCHTDLWCKVIQNVNDGDTTFIECGNGKVLTGIFKNIDKKVKPLMASTPRDLEKIKGLI